MTTDRPAPNASNPAPAGQQAMATKSRQASQDDYDDDEEEYEEEGGSNRFLLFAAVPSWLTSMVFHIIVLLILALIPIAVRTVDNYREITIGDTDKDVEEIEEFEEEEVEKLDMDLDVVVDPQPDTENIQEEPVITPADDLDSAPITVELNPLGDSTAPANDLMREIGSYTGTGLSGRGKAARSGLVRAGGGTKGSEAAVAAALKWFAAHQNMDGSWSFDHRGGPCQGRCGNPGSLKESPNGATGLALLPFLGAGQTHKEGEYKETVKKGLAFLMRRMKVQGGRGSLSEPGGTMYSHGVCSIVLCEACAMTHDKGLMAPAQMSINHIGYAQDPVGGGWRYQDKQAGDTSAVGWQLMALKSAHMAYLQVPPGVVQKASKFLDSTQTESGAKYGYTGPGSGAATTAVGLLSRMYLGWKKDNGALTRGVAFLDSQGPSHSNMYFNYYATQIMRHYEGDTWKKWNPKMRDWLVSTQSKEGHSTGSWYVGGDHGSGRGGRLYTTSMATMILEVYYRHLPIYRKQAAEEDFPL